MGKLLVIPECADRWTANLEDCDTLAGYGSTSKEAIGDFFVANADKLFGVDVEIDPYRHRGQYLLPTNFG